MIVCVCVGRIAQEEKTPVVDVGNVAMFKAGVAHGEMSHPKQTLGHPYCFPFAATPGVTW